MGVLFDCMRLSLLSIDQQLVLATYMAVFRVVSVRIQVHL